MELCGKRNMIYILGSCFKDSCVSKRVSKLLTGTVEKKRAKVC